MSIKLFTLTALAFGAVSAPLYAQPSPTPSMVKTFQDWGVYSYRSGGSASCYALTMAKDAQPTSVQHGDNFFLVAPKSSGSGYYPQAIMGYDLREGSQMRATIDGEAFVMTAKGNGGWTAEESRDPALIAALRSGRSMTLEAMSKRGTQTRYTFSLSGITAALTEASRCR
jgi:invasion protein IalB